MIDRYPILRYFVKNGVNKNNCKVIICKRSRCKYFLIIRGRAYPIYYYLIEVRGNEIRAFRESEGNIDWDNYSHKILRNKLFLSTKLKDYKLFVAKFKELTPDLDWYTESNSEEQL